MVDAPCSRVGHIYRKFAPFANPGVGDFIGRNYKRVAEVKNNVELWLGIKNDKKTSL